MPKQARRPRPAPPARPFTPVATRARHDGWTPEKQAGFIDALAASGCVHEACATVGMGRQSAYMLRARPDAQGFRLAWDAALDMAIRRLSDECYSRAMNGVAVPHFYRGEQVGEHRRYDNRLAMFLLRYRDPLRYAATLDQMVYDGHPEIAALGLARARDRMMDEAYDLPDADAAPAPAPLPFTAEPVHDARARQKVELVQEAERRRRAEVARQTEEIRLSNERSRREIEEQRRTLAEGRAGGGVVSPLSTSAAVPPPVPRGPDPRLRVIGGG